MVDKPRITDEQLRGLAVQHGTDVETVREWIGRLTEPYLKRLYAVVRELQLDGTLAQQCCVCEHGRMVWPALGLEDVKLCIRHHTTVAPLAVCGLPGRPAGPLRCAPGVVSPRTDMGVSNEEG